MPGELVIFAFVIVETAVCEPPGLAGVDLAGRTRPMAPWPIVGWPIVGWQRGGQQGRRRRQALEDVVAGKFGPRDHESSPRRSAGPAARGAGKLGSEAGACLPATSSVVGFEVGLTSSDRSRSARARRSLDGRHDLVIQQAAEHSPLYAILGGAQTARALGDLGIATRRRTADAPPRPAGLNSSRHYRAARPLTRHARPGRGRFGRNLGTWPDSRLRPGRAFRPARRYRAAASARRSALALVQQDRPQPSAEGVARVERMPPAINRHEASCRFVGQGLVPQAAAATT